MDNDADIPVLMTLIFGEQARVAYIAASKRLHRWCRAFDDWLAYREKRYAKNTCRKSL